MRAVVQRVTAASVAIAGAVVGEIGAGALVLVGLRKGDTDAAAERLLHRLLTMRLWPDASGRPWAESLSSQPALRLLLVSQFTLHASVAKAKPSYHVAMATDPARAAFERFVAAARAKLGAERVATGEFGAMMAVSLTNDGPVTLIVDTDDFSGGGGGGGGGDDAAGDGSAADGGSEASPAAVVVGGGAGASAAASGGSGAV